jgi:outer membrane protein OmpA-like peptidoglycan-associated protein
LLALFILFLRGFNMSRLFFLICLHFTTQNLKGAGLNIESYQPVGDAESALYWWSPVSLKLGWLSLGTTLSYLLRPVEFGDGEERLPIVNHLFLGHFTGALSLSKYFEPYVRVPIALFSQANSQSYISEVDDEFRDFLVFGDLSLGFKSFIWEKGGFQSGLGIQFDFPTGTAQKLLSDRAYVLRVLFPLQMQLPHPRLFARLTPSYNFWTNGARMSFLNYLGEPLFLNSYQKKHALGVQTSIGFWLDRRTANSGLLVEGGLRTERNLTQQTEAAEGNQAIFPGEWSVGATLFRGPWSYNVQGGSAIGPGVSAPLLRLIAGVRYEMKLLDLDDGRQGDGDGREQDTSKAYSDSQLDQIFSNADAERQNYETYNDLYSYLKLLTRRGVIEVGALQFEFDSARLTPQAKQTVKDLFNILQELNPKQVHIEGHTDSIGSYEYNLALSKRRADSVKAELQSLGFTKPITTEGLSWKHPMASNATREGRSQNRRIEVAIDGLRFRTGRITQKEERLYKKWNYPGGRKPTPDMDAHDLAE